MENHDLDWYLERLSPAKWMEESEGSRDLMTNCPVCGGSDPLHLTERRGKVLGHCFSCSSKLPEVAQALDAEPTEEEQPEAPRMRVTFGKKGDNRRRVSAAKITPGGEQPGAAAAAPQGHSDPMAWYSAYVDVPEPELAAYGVSVTADGWLAHTWLRCATTKQRKPGTSERRVQPKGGGHPRLWPDPNAFPLEKVIWICEGESDAITLRHHYHLPAYSAGSATQPLDESELKALKAWGVEQVVVAYDNDKEGRGGRDKTLEACLKVGMLATTADLADPIMGGPKDWRERWGMSITEVPETGASEASEAAFVLRDVPAATATKLLVDYIHPDDHTILFGDGGTGKGVIAAWWMARMIGTGQVRKILVVDYEEHATWEWRPRLEAFADWLALHRVPNAKDILDSVIIMQPDGPIWDEAATICAVIEQYDIDLVVVDSVTYACLPMEPEKAVTAGKYSDTIKLFRKPVLSLAHTTKADTDPQHPFGSVFWSNGARITVAVSRTDFGGPRKLEVKKANQGQVPKVQEVDWSWSVNQGPPSHLDIHDAKQSARDLVREGILTGAVTDAATARAYVQSIDPGIKDTAISAAWNKEKGVGSGVQQQPMAPRVKTARGTVLHTPEQP